jgi:hypothetical protein
MDLKIVIIVQMIVVLVLQLNIVETIFVTMAKPVIRVGQIVQNVLKYVEMGNAQVMKIV